MGAVQVFKTFTKMREEINRIFSNQVEFQKLVGIDFLELDEDRKDELAEGHLFKAIEEIVELLKTQPSAINKYSKTRPEVNENRMLDELSDVILFLINFCIFRGLNPEKVLKAIVIKQGLNFLKLEARLKNESIS